MQQQCELKWMARVIHNKIKPYAQQVYSGLQNATLFKKSKIQHFYLLCNQSIIIGIGLEYIYMHNKLPLGMGGPEDASLSAP
jgi:hypothetical protein